MEHKVLNVAIVGGGPGCKAIMDMIFAEKLRELRMTLIGVACTNPKAEGYLYAREKGIYTTQDFRDLYQLKDLNMIIELTGRDDVVNEIFRSKPGHVRLMGNVAARLFWDVFRIEEKRTAERAQAEEALRKSEREKEAILNSISEYVVYHDSEHRMVWANGVARQVSGLDPDEVVGRRCYEVWHQLSKPCPGCPVVKTYETGQPQKAEMTSPDGRTWFVRGYPLRDENEAITGVVEITMDITERKRTEEALRKAHDELEQRVGERTADLEAANEELSEYNHAVAHVLKTPLRAIHNYADFLRQDLKDILNKSHIDHLDRLNQAVHQGVESVDGLLDLATLGRQSEMRELMDMGVFLKGLIGSLHLSPDIEVVMATDWPTIEADKAILRHAFEDLIINAVKFNDSSRKRIEIGWLPVGGKRVEVFVRDNGIGVAPRYHEHIFGGFERLHAGDGYEGLGLGLTTVKKAVAKLHGSVRLESTPGKGSTFFVTLPKRQKEMEI
jgi:PAS domain S-box-containing protein